MFEDAEYLRAGAQIAYRPGEVLGRTELLVKIGRPQTDELAQCAARTTLLAFYQMAVADREFLDALSDRGITAIGCEIIQRDDGTLPVLAAISEIAGQMTVPIAAHLLRSSSRRPRHPVRWNARSAAGSVGFAAARSAAAAGVCVTVFDRDPQRLRHLMEHGPSKPVWPTKTQSRRPWLPPMS